LQTEEEFLLDDYNSDDEIEKNVDQKMVLGGGNLAPEVLKMLQQMTPTTTVGKEEDEPDEIKVFVSLDVGLRVDILCFPDTFSTDAVRG
jgi:hypothetical protein